VAIAEIITVIRVGIGKKERVVTKTEVEEEEVDSKEEEAVMVETNSTKVLLFLILRLDLKFNFYPIISDFPLHHVDLFTFTKLILEAQYKETIWMLSF